MSSPLSSRPLSGGNSQNNSPSPTNGPAPPPISPVIPIPGQTDFPNNSSYAGDFKFTVAFTKANEVESKKTISYVYSESLNKLYVCIKKTCPVNFKVSGKPPRGSIVRAMAIYSRPQDVSEPVRRCMIHAAEDRDDPLREHFVRCQNPNASHVDEQARHSVFFRWEEPQAGCYFNIGLYQFTCFSSCTGTINRRPTQLVFTLEYEGNVLGRQVVDLRICACPGRDKVSDEGIKDRKHRSSHDTTGHHSSSHYFAGHPAFGLEPPQKRFRSEETEIYTIQVRGRETYELVKSVVEKLEQARKYTELMSEAGFNAAQSSDHHHLGQSDLPSPTSLRQNGFSSVLKMSPDLCDSYEVTEANPQLKYNPDPLNLSPRQHMLATGAGVGACLPISSVSHLHVPCSSSAMLSVINSRPSVLDHRPTSNTSTSSGISSVEVDVPSSALRVPGGSSSLVAGPAGQLLVAQDRSAAEPGNKISDWIAEQQQRSTVLREPEDMDVNANIYGYVQRLLGGVNVTLPSSNDLYNRLLYAAAGSLPPLLPGTLAMDSLSALTTANHRFAAPNAGLLSSASLPLQLKPEFAVAADRH